MVTYEEKIKGIHNPSFAQIRQVAMDELSFLSNEKRDDLYNSLNRGIALLDSNEQLCQYLFSYGKMHEAKIQTALSKLPKDLFKHDIQIIDWGCGQGLATICLFDYLKNKNLPDNINRIVLIEPAELTLNRAVLHTNIYAGKDCEIIAKQKPLNQITEDDIRSKSEVTLHFFSNILDVNSVDVQGVANIIANTIQGEHYFICVGPLNVNNRRIDAFANWFKSPEIIWEEEHNKDEKRTYTAKYKLFKIERFENNPILVPFNPPVQFHAAYQLDGIRKACEANKEKKQSLLKHLSSFEVSAPFDIGASIYDDKNPIYAVLNNIVTRGLPTKASPLLENAFEPFGNKKEEETLGCIDYSIEGINDEDIFLALHALDNRLKYNCNNYNKNYLDSDLEKKYITEISPSIFRHFLLPQRSLDNILDTKNHYAQRVDFAVEYPYGDKKGCVIELDGRKYHSSTSQQIKDNERTKSLIGKQWSCIRIKDNEINNNDFNYLENSEYIKTLFSAYNKPYDASWIKTLQTVLSPIAVARIEKTVIEALLIKKIDISQKNWNVLVIERDVPCAVLAFLELSQMIYHICKLSDEFNDYVFPKINLTVISSKEFSDSPLHHIDSKYNIIPEIKNNPSDAIKNKMYDMVIDIAVMRRAGLENISFSDYKCKNNCYFNIRSAHYIRTPRYIYTSDTINYKPLVTKDHQGNYHVITDLEEHIRYFLQFLFRKVSFRSGQLPILSRALQNKSVIGLLPTGGGKSLTYQIAAMLQPGITVIVDPLRSLMKDQYDGLMNAGIDTCTFINATVDAVEKEKRCKAMENSLVQFVFLSPERLCIYSFREKLKNMNELGVYFSYGVIDEVHCVSEWGHDFRFTYLHLGRNLYNYVLPKQTKYRKHITLIGLTATASFDVMTDVERELSGNGKFPLDSDSIIRDENTNRLELQYKIERVAIEFPNDITFIAEANKYNLPLPKKIDKYYDEKHLKNDTKKYQNKDVKYIVYENKQNFLSNYLDKIPVYFQQLQTRESLKVITDKFFRIQSEEKKDCQNISVNMPRNFGKKKDEYEQAGIIFCPHKENTGVSVTEIETSISEQMQVGTFMGSSDADWKDGKNTDEKSLKNMKLFIGNKLPLMIATKSFGMGIDKPNVRFTVNMNYSSSLEGFIQEAGRAGRDRHTALSIILLSDYKLVRISPKYQTINFFSNIPNIIIGNWFKEDDLKFILERYNLKVPDEYIDIFTPDKDMVKLRCKVCDERFKKNKCESECSECPKGPCRKKCIMSKDCKLRLVPEAVKGEKPIYIEDLKEILSQEGLQVPIMNLEYQNVDYETVMYFYNQNFKGLLIEKWTMFDLLNRTNIDISEKCYDGTKKYYHVDDFLEHLLNQEVGTKLTAYIHGEKVISKAHDNKIQRNKDDIEKAIYRMCCIGLIDDFTITYSSVNDNKNVYRIVTVRKADGEYYKELQRFLERYYSKAKAAEEIKKVPNYEGKNEIHKCLGYLTEFIYDKIAVKRKRAIDDMRTFCMIGAVDKIDWLTKNEILKEHIYYYFNSKYAREDFKYPDMEGDNKYSLTTETDHGKDSNFATVLKYMSVVDDIITTQDASSQIDNAKHLQGAVRLIRRATDNNYTIDFLNVFCLLFLGIGENANLLEELKNSYIDGYLAFNKEYNGHIEFYDKINEYKQALIKRKITNEQIKLLDQWELEAELNKHVNWTNNFKQQYLK